MVDPTVERWGPNSAIIRVMLLALTCLLAAPAIAQDPETTAEANSNQPRYSQLWVEHGEHWTPESNLPDFSYAGYRRGEKAIPNPPVACNVKDFGAVGDGEADDTQAILAAIAATDRGAVYLPAGRYKVSGIIEISKPRIVLRGAGPEETVLVFTKPLNDIRPNWGETTGGRRTSNYSWSGGLVSVKGNYRSKKLSSISGSAKRGENRLAVDNSDGMKVGQWVEIQLSDDAQKSLTHHLYSGDPGNISKHRGSRASLLTRIADVAPGKITLERPLRWDVRPEWKPVVKSIQPTVQEVGVEHLSFEFPNQPYQGHFTELGFNALAMSNVVNCWARNLHIKNSDSGIFTNSRFCTIRDVIFKSERKANRGNTGHHGVLLGGHDNLFTRFDFQTRFIHDIGLSAGHSGNVFSNGKGVDLAFDHHKRAPHENLFTNIHVGAGKRTWHSGGGASLGKNCGARGTFWNIRADQPQQKPPTSFGPATLNLVGVHGVGEGGAVEPLDLHRAQLHRRLQLQVVQDRINRLEPFVGTYPPRFSNDKDKERALADWKRAYEIINQYAHLKTASETEFFLLGEMMRLGHNFEIEGIGGEAVGVYKQALTRFPHSVKLHKSSMDFHLFINPKFGAPAKTSLEFLRKHYHPKLNEDVEAGWAWYHLVHGDKQTAIREMKKFIKNFPDAKRDIQFEMAKIALGGQPDPGPAAGDNADGK